jgi:hypothetical protein
MTVTKTDHRSLVVLKLPTRVQGLITYANGIVKALTAGLAASMNRVIGTLVRVAV